MHSTQQFATCTLLYPIYVPALLSRNMLQAPYESLNTTDNQSRAINKTIQNPHVIVPDSHTTHRFAPLRRVARGHVLVKFRGIATAYHKKQLIIHA